MSANMLNVIKTDIPHVYRIDLEGNGMAHECAVLQQDKFGNILYLKISELDMIDRDRIGRILHHRFIRQLPLWDVMSQTTLKNNMNALDYFHQLVKGVTSEGKPYTPRAGARGYSINQTMDAARQAEAERIQVQGAKHAAAEAAVEADVVARSPGRPKAK